MRGMEIRLREFLILSFLLQTVITSLIEKFCQVCNALIIFGGLRYVPPIQMPLPPLLEDKNGLELESGVFPEP